VWTAIERAVDLGCEAVQLFTQAPGRWEGAPIDDEAAARFRDEAGAAGLSQDRMVAHAPYLINLAAGDDWLRRRSVELLVAQLRVSARLGLCGLVLHPGAHAGDGVEIGVARVVAGADEALDRVPDGRRRLPARARRNPARVRARFGVHLHDWRSDDTG
jgi:deoxyribonuclease-4